MISTCIKDLLTAHFAGEDCLFALHDTLIDEGYPEILWRHFESKEQHCKRCWAIRVILGKVPLYKGDLLFEIVCRNIRYFLTTQYYDEGCIFRNVNYDIAIVGNKIICYNKNKLKGTLVLRYNHKIVDEQPANKEVIFDVR